MRSRNRVLEKLEKNGPVLIGSPTPMVTPKITELIGRVGFDCIWIDAEHQDMDDHDIFNMCLGARASGAEPMVRLQKGDYWSYFRPLEIGATGIMVPHVKTGEEAELIVRNAKYAPMGLRGIDCVEAPADYGMADPIEYMKWANENTFICVQIEDKEAVPNIDEIAAVEGIDILFIGPSDLSQSFGTPLQFESPKVKEVFDLVASATKKHGKAWGCPCGSAERMKELLDMGALFIAWGAAIHILSAGYREIKRQFDETCAAR